MFLDASAIVAILAGEEDAGYLIAKIEIAKKPIFYSSLSIFEAVISLARIISISQNGDEAPTPPDLIDQAQEDVEQFLETIGAREMSVSGSMHRKAIEAARSFGRFAAHPARLNFGDCFAYACAKEFRLPILFKGEDFSKTDLEAA
ncbi:type II toxin-antitoxin system VapC family toxin [Phyllobacterium salinisoli]|uniref:Type II toxin-antitoxin system VapC family toxin n=1 Tax=Phyllobacterium salinisoli TaxID=1899321 RepID=A0A368JWQ8_9HYPH|nr:type II toxin-antitoxin system VapC family toxin [Phyllobacterium salinisoli]RCS21598.1 type II toxin-antitoxin system VapC family toxin [Phyllobacterium salinisoli]